MRNYSIIQCFCHRRIENVLFCTLEPARQSAYVGYRIVPTGHNWYMKFIIEINWHKIENSAALVFYLPFFFNAFLCFYNIKHISKLPIGGIEYIVYYRPISIIECFYFWRYSFHNLVLLNSFALRFFITLKIATFYRMKNLVNDLRANS